MELLEHLDCAVPDLSGRLRRVVHDEIASDAMPDLVFLLRNSYMSKTTTVPNFHSHRNLGSRRTYG